MEPPNLCSTGSYFLSFLQITLTYLYPISIPYPLYILKLQQLRNSNKLYFKQPIWPLAKYLPSYLPSTVEHPLVITGILSVPLSLPKQRVLARLAVRELCQPPA